MMTNKKNDGMENKEIIEKAMKALNKEDLSTAEAGICKLGAILDLMHQAQLVTNRRLAPKTIPWVLILAKEEFERLKEILNLQ
jgi:hypothetical protein